MHRLPVGSLAGTRQPAAGLNVYGRVQQASRRRSDYCGVRAVCGAADAILATYSSAGRAGQRLPFLCGPSAAR